MASAELALLSEISDSPRSLREVRKKLNSQLLRGRFSRCSPHIPILVQMQQLFSSCRHPLRLTAPRAEHTAHKIKVLWVCSPRCRGEALASDAHAALIESECKRNAMAAIQTTIIPINGNRCGDPIEAMGAHRIVQAAKHDMASSLRLWVWHLARRFECSEGRSPDWDSLRTLRER